MSCAFGIRLANQIISFEAAVLNEIMDIKTIYINKQFFNLLQMLN